MKRRLGTAGYTLVEVMVTVAIIGILAAIAIPTFVNVMPRVRLGTAEQTLANEVAMLRMTAIAKSLDCQVTFSAVGDSYGLAKSVGGTPYSTTSLLASADLEPLTYLDGTAAPNTLTLYANGTTSVPLQKQALLVTLSLRNEPAGQKTLKKRILIWATGRINAEKSPDGGASWTGD